MKAFDINGLNWFENKNPSAGPIGGEMCAESYEDDFNDVPDIFCDSCGEKMTFTGYEGDYGAYMCDSCGEWKFTDDDGTEYSNEDLWNKELINGIDEALEKHDELNPDLFNENRELKPEVKKKLLEIADKFKENLEEDDIKLDVKDIRLVGSNASYNYNNQSDIDLHIQADLSVYDGNEDLVEKLYNAYKCLWNSKYDPTIYGHEVEVYVEPYDSSSDLDGELTETISNGVYSLYNGWIRQPKKENIPDNLDVSTEVAEYTSKANSCKTIDDIDDFIDDLYKIRQGGLISDGEFSTGNLIFKELRNAGVIQELKDKKISLQNDEMSLTESYKMVKRLLYLFD